VWWPLRVEDARGDRDRQDDSAHLRAAPLGRARPCGRAVDPKRESSQEPRTSEGWRGPRIRRFERARVTPRDPDRGRARARRTTNSAALKATAQEASVGPRSRPDG
jgi:hypothetical protein